MSILFVLTLALFALATAEENDPSVTIEGITDLTSTNFDEVVGKDMGVLVEFYAPWCGHCKALVPVMHQLGAAVKASQTKKFAIAKVNADEHSSLSSRFGVKGFPTLKYFPAGSQEAEDYQGGRDIDAFISFINSKTGAGLFVPKAHTYVTSLNENNFNSIVMDKSKNVLVKFFAPWCGHCKKLAPEYEIVAHTFSSENNIVIAELNADEPNNKVIAEKYGVSGFPTIKFFAANDKEKNAEDYNEGRTAKDFIEFINKKTGSKRVSGGDLSNDAGTHEALNVIVKKFLESPSKELIQEMNDEAAKIGDSTAKHYARYAAKILENDNYASKELARLDKLLEGKVSPKRKDDIQYRKNILSIFKK